MQKAQTTSKLLVRWELVDDPDPESLAQALALLFRRKPKPDSTVLDKTAQRANLQEQK